MADNTTLSPMGGGDAVRDLQRSGNLGAKTQVVQLDFAGPSTNPEQLVSSSNPLPVGGPGAVNSPIVGAPVLVGGTDGTNAQLLGIDAQNAAKTKPKSLTITGTGQNAGDVLIPATDVSDYAWVHLSINCPGSPNWVEFEFSNDDTVWSYYQLYSPEQQSFQAQNYGNGSFSGPLFGRFFRVSVVNGNSSLPMTATATFSAAPRAVPLTVLYPFYDSYPATNFGLVATARMQGFNAPLNTSENWRNNQDVTLLSSAQRTTTTASAVQSNYNGPGRVRLVLNVTEASGTGGLQLQIQGVDSTSSAFYQLNASPTPVIANGVYVYELNPSGIPASPLPPGITQATQTFAPRSWRINVAHGDTSPYTYSVSAVTMAG